MSSTVSRKHFSLVPGREAALAWASLAQRFPASSVLAREGAGCGSVRIMYIINFSWILFHFPKTELIKI